MLRRELLVVMAAGVLVPGAGRAAAAGQVASVEGGSLVLADGRKLWLLGVLMPQAGATPEQGEPGAAEVDAALAADAVGRAVELSAFMGPDRGGRFGAIVTLSGDQGSLNERLIRGGWGRVYLLPGLAKADDPGATLLPGLLRAEAAARAEGRGLWHYPAYRPRQAGAEDLWSARDRFHLVEGRVRRVMKRAGFGAELTLGEGRNALRVLIASPVGRALKAQGTDPHDLDDAKLRVRGWLTLGGGLTVTLERPEYLEKLP